MPVLVCVAFIFASAIMAVCTVHNIIAGNQPDTSKGETFVWPEKSSPEANLFFLSDTRILCPIDRRLFVVTVGDKHPNKPIYEHQENIRLVSASPNGRRVVVYSTAGITELNVLDDQMTVVKTTLIEGSVVDFAVADDGVLVVCTKGLKGTVFIRKHPDDVLQAVHRIASTKDLPRVVKTEPSVGTAAINLSAARVVLGYERGIVSVALDNAKKSDHFIIANSAIDILAVGINSSSGDLVAVCNGELLIKEGAVENWRRTKIGNVMVPNLAVLSKRNIVGMVASLGNHRRSTCRFYDLSSGKLIGETELSPDAAGRWLAFSPNGTYAASVTAYGLTTLKVWRVDGIIGMDK